jgi:hypothetical protein
MIDQTLKNEKATRTAARRKQRKVLFVGELVIASCSARRTHRCVGVQGKGEQFFARFISTPLTHRSAVNLAKAPS